jgi:hypothetical protein
MIAGDHLFRVAGITVLDGGVIYDTSLSDNTVVQTFTVS